MCHWISLYYHEATDEIQQISICTWIMMKTPTTIGTQYYQCNALIDIMLVTCPKNKYSWTYLMVFAEILRHFTTDADDSSHCHPLINHTTHHGFSYVIYSMWYHSDTAHENSPVICGNSIKCKCNQAQLGQPTMWANYIMVVITTSSRNVCCMWKRIIMFQIIFINNGCQLFINGILERKGANWFQLWSP